MSIKRKPTPKPKPKVSAKRNPQARVLAAHTAARSTPIEPDARLVVQVPLGTGGLNLRKTPGGELIFTLTDGSFLCVREPNEIAMPKLGVAGQWLPVVTTGGTAGFVSAQWVRSFLVAPVVPTPPTPPPITPPTTPSIAPEIIAQNTVIASADLTLASGWRVLAGTPLRVAEGGNWAGKIGDANQLVRVQSYAFKDGTVRGSDLRAPASADKRPLADDAVLPFGISAYTFGMHDAFDRNLFAGSGRLGWVLFTSLVGGDPLPNYADWAMNGYGILGRLNNDYGGSGTIPTPDRYDEFAQRCANWVRTAQAQITGDASKHRRVWIIGNEMNNPREWPEEGRNPSKAIHPEQYADCFNRARRAIRSVDPKAIVVPGAIDPYNATWGNPLDYWNRMFARFEDLDGIALHAYTHGPPPNLITSLGTFGDDPLRWQYFDFRCYTTFIDLIPQRYRNRPLYITETNATPHDGQPAWAGGRNGWVPEAYRETSRWNAQPHAQQIQALILYRWIRGGGSDAQFAISEKPGVQDDFRDAIRGQDNRWRA
jgi:hypothetical protein